MNVLTIIILLVFVIFSLNGYRRGFIKVFASMFFFLLASVMVYFTTPYISQFMKDYTPVYEIVESSCKDVFKAEGDEKKEKDAGEDDEKKEEDTSFLEQKKFIENLEIPEILKQQLINNNNDSSYQGLNISVFSDYIASYMANIILNILTFIVTMIIVTIILWMTIMTLDAITNLPVLSGINRFLGFILGLGQGLLAIWIFFLIVTVFSHVDAGQKLMLMIHQSPILEFLYNENVFLHYLLQCMDKFL